MSRIIRFRRWSELKMSPGWAADLTTGCPTVACTAGHRAKFCRYRTICTAGYRTSLLATSPKFLCPRSLYLVRRGFCPVFCPSRVPSRAKCIFFASQEYWTDFDEIRDSYSHYHERMKWLHFGHNWNTNMGAGFDRIFESTSIGFGATCWHLANEFTNFTAQTIQRTRSHVNLEISLTKFM